MTIIALADRHFHTFAAAMTKSACNNRILSLFFPLQVSQQSTSSIFERAFFLPLT